jgi:hypothetical protein
MPTTVLDGIRITAWDGTVTQQCKMVGGENMELWTVG